MGRLCATGDISSHFHFWKRQKACNSKSGSSRAPEVWVCSKPGPQGLRRTTTHRGLSARPFFPPALSKLHFPSIPVPHFPSAPSRRTSAGSSSRRSSRQVPGGRTVRDGGVWLRRCVRGRDPGGWAHRPRPLRRGIAGVPATRCAAARLPCPRCQVPEREGWGRGLSNLLCRAGPWKAET
jgi:hypothetical protein